MNIFIYLCAVVIYFAINPCFAYSKVYIQNTKGAKVAKDTFADAIKASASKTTTIIVNENTPIDDFFIIPQNISVKIEKSGFFSGNGSIDFKGRVQIDKSDKHHIFTNNGLVTGLLISVPEFFGAMPDNKSNNTIPIQRAMKASNNIIFSEGTYLVASAISILSNTNIEGAGKDKSIIKLMSSSNMSPFSGIFQAINMTNIKISNIAINGNRTGQAGIYRAHNIYIVNSSYVSIDNCSSISSNHEGFCFDGSPFCTVKSCYTTDSVNSGIALRLSPSHPNQLEPSTNLQSNDFKCTENTSYRDGNVSGIGAVGISINALRCIVSRNTIIEAGLAGIAVGHLGATATGNKKAIPAQDASFSVFSNNIIKGCGFKNKHEPESKRGAGILLTYAPKGAVIENNTITDTYGDAISAVNESKRINNSVIRGNTIDKSDKAGIAIGNHDNILVDGNIISNSGLAFNYYAAIRQEGKSSGELRGVGNIYKNNKIYDTHGNGSAGIKITAGVNTKVINNLVSNRAKDAKGFGVLIQQDANGSKLENNNFEGNLTIPIKNNSSSTVHEH